MAYKIVKNILHEHGIISAIPLMTYSGASWQVRHQRNVSVWCNLHGQMLITDYARI